MSRKTAKTHPEVPPDALCSPVALESSIPELPRLITGYCMGDCLLLRYNRFQYIIVERVIWVLCLSSLVVAVERFSNCNDLGNGDVSFLHRSNVEALGA